MSALPATDPRDARRAVGAGGKLRAFNEAGVLAAADVHVARALAELTGTTDEDVLLATALAVRRPRLGHVRVDLALLAPVAVEVQRGADEAQRPVVGRVVVAVGDERRGGDAL